MKKRPLSYTYEDLYGSDDDQIVYNATSKDGESIQKKPKYSPFAMRQQALPVLELPQHLDFSTEPKSAEEYLMRVRWESHKYPNVFVSTIDPKQYANNQTSLLPAGILANHTQSFSIPVHVRPCSEWRQEFLDEFSEARQWLVRLSARKQFKSLQFSTTIQSEPSISSIITAITSSSILPHKRDWNSWFLLCSENLQNLVGDTLVNGIPSLTLSTLLNFDFVFTNDLLVHLIEWICCGYTQNKDSNTPKKQKSTKTSTEIITTSKNKQTLDEDKGTSLELTKEINIEENIKVEHSNLNEENTDKSTTKEDKLRTKESHQFIEINQQSVMWLYYLLMKLEKPLLTDTQAALAQLFKYILKKRSKLTAGDQAIILCNIILTIVGDYFKQSNQDFDGPLCVSL